MPVASTRHLSILFAVLLLLLGGCSSFGGRRISAVPDEASVSGAYLQGRFAAQDFDIPKAEEAFLEVARRTSLARGHRTAFAYALALGSIADAEEQARLVLAQRAEGAPSDEAAQAVQVDLPRLTLAAAAMRDGNSERALELLRRDLRSPLGESLAVLLRSAAAYDAAGMDAATRELSDQEPGTFRGLVPLHAAFLFELHGDRDAARTAFRQAVGAPRGEIAALGLARLHERDGADAEAEAIYRRMVQDAGLFTRAGRMGLVRLGLLDGEPRAFVKAAGRAREEVPDARALFALALENYAWLGFEQSIRFDGSGPRADEARLASMIVPLGLANLARSVDPDRAAAHYLASLIFSAYGTPEPAIAAADAIPPESWLYGYARLEVATAHASRDDIGAAVSTLTKAMKRDGGPAPQWALQAAILFASEERYEDADRYATQAIRSAEKLGVLPSSLWRYYFTRGATRLDAGRWPEARADLEKALALAPDDPIILNHLGYSYVERGEQLERAFGMIERALDIDPQNGAIVDSLGWAHFQQGNYQLAVENLEVAVGLEPADAVITDHLGDAYYMVGRERDARYEWERVLTLEDADDALREGVRAKLRGDFTGFPILAARDGGA